MLRDRDGRLPRGPSGSALLLCLTAEPHLVSCIWLDDNLLQLHLVLKQKLVHLISASRYNLLCLILSSFTADTLQEWASPADAV